MRARIAVGLFLMVGYAFLNPELLRVVRHGGQAVFRRLEPASGRASEVLRLHLLDGTRRMDGHEGANVELAQQMSNRCFTPSFWCFLPGYAPIGAPCWCATPYGPVGGIVQ